MTTTKIMLADILDASEFEKLVKKRLLTERAHPDDPNFRIYSYGKTIQYSGLWTKEAMIARGLMLELPASGDFSQAIVRGRGLPKFFTIEQVDSDWGRVKLVDDDENVTVNSAPILPWDEPAIVNDKLNGALGLAYLNPAGIPAISTKGSFESLEASAANRVLAEKYSLEKLKEFMLGELSGKTPLFEIITPERPHPIDYGDLEDILYLGVMDDATGVWEPAAEDSLLVRELGFSYAVQDSGSTLREAVEAPYRQNTEGLVVTVGTGLDQSLFKVKPQEYLSLRRLFYATNTKELKAFVKTLSNEELKSITAPNEIKLSDYAMVEENSNTKKMLDERKQLIFDEFIKPIQEKAAWARETAVAELEDAMLLPTERALVAKLFKKKYSKDSGLLFRALDDLETGEDRVFGMVKDSFLKN